MGSWIFAGLTGYELLEKRIGSWVEAPATLTGTSTPRKLRSGQQRGVEFGTRIHYSFEVDGVTREGTESGIFNAFDTSEAAADALEAFVSSHEGDFIARYSATNPDSFYLVVSGKENRTVVAFAVCLIAGLVSTFALLGSLGKKRLSPMPEATA